MNQPLNGRPVVANPLTALRTILPKQPGAANLQFSDDLELVDCLAVVQGLCKWTEDAAKQAGQKGLRLSRGFDQQVLSHSDSLALTEMVHRDSSRNFERLLDRAEAGPTHEQLLDIRETISEHRATFAAVADNDPVISELLLTLQRLDTLLRISLERGVWLLPPRLLGQVTRDLFGFHVGLTYESRVSIGIVVLSIIASIAGLVPPLAIPAFLSAIGLSATGGLPTLASLIRDEQAAAQKKMDDSGPTAIEPPA